MNELNNLSDLPDQLDIENQTSAETKITLVEERLKIDIRKIETGTVQIHKKVISEQVMQEVPVTSEEVQVERVAINKYVDAAPTVRYEGDTTIISVVKEILVVEKRLMLVEELHISKKQITTLATVTETLRKEEIEIDRTDTSQENF